MGKMNKMLGKNNQTFCRDSPSSGVKWAQHVVSPVLTRFWYKQPDIVGVFSASVAVCEAECEPDSTVSV